ncbi:MAG: helix-turn-helix domain-containing protein [Clostridia bacterium]|nr:helix-turn-helix domain-containing protein [Clostridia bacterium]
MTTGEKLVLLRKNRGMTQEMLADILNVSRQSVSRWEMDIAFPETDKLIRLSKLFECSIDYLLTDNSVKQKSLLGDISVDDACGFIRDCGFFFLATAEENQPKLRPMGMVYSKGNHLFFVTDKRKRVYFDLEGNSNIEIATYNLHTRRWLRIHGNAELEGSEEIREEIINAYPILIQKYPNESEMFLAIYKVFIDDIKIT